MPVDVGSLKKDFTKRFLSLCSRKSKYEAWRDWTEVAAIVCCQAPTNGGLLPRNDEYDRVEAEYLSLVKRWERSDLDAFAELFGMVQLFFVGGGRSDFLGEVYQQLELSSNELGQFFTPYSLAKVTAEMTLEEKSVKEAIAKKGYVSVLEPCCGGGAMLIAVTERLETLGYDPRDILYFEAIDIDRTCFNLTYIQMSSLGACGAVIHGDSLSQKVCDRRLTPRLQVLQRTDPSLPTATPSVVKDNAPRPESSAPPARARSAIAPRRPGVKKKSAETVDAPRQLNLFEDL